MKTCSKCKEEKLFSEFSRSLKKKDNLQNQCKSCVREYQKLNKERRSGYKQKYNESNRDKILNDYRKYRKIYRSINKDKINALNAKRRADKLQATPNWLTKEELQQIEELYEIAQAFKLYTGDAYHVDHIVPLQGKNVCGLHVPWNLQVIPAKENLSKHNKLLD